MDQDHLPSRWIYLSYPFGPSCPAYGGGEPVSFEQTKSLANGDSCHQIRFTSSNHIGTHIDMPFHFCENGKRVLDYQAESFVFHSVALVWLSLLPGTLITQAHLESELKKAGPDLELLLIRSGAGLYRQESTYWQNGTGMAPGTASWLRSRYPSLRAIGLDSISLTSFSHRQEGRSCHKEFLCENPPLLIIEDAHLEALQNHQPQMVIALPLRLEGSADGAPCTIIAEMKF